MVGGKDGQGEVVSSRRVSRDKDVAGLTPGQKAKYDAYMEYTAGRKDKRSADLIHSDAMMHAMNPKAPSIPKAQSQSSGPKVTRKPRNPGAYAPIESIRSAIKEHDALLRENLTARSRKQVESARERAVEILAAAEKRQKKIKGEAQKLGEESKKKYKEYGY